MTLNPTPTGSRPGLSSGRSGWLTTLGWAAYLACSWTWCIGMFLPVLLVRDYGVWGFVVFAVPNVVGAAAMGWVLKPGMSERIVVSHRAAIQTFSIVTIAFQFFFVCWMYTWEPPGSSGNHLSDLLWFSAIVLGFIFLYALRSHGRPALVAAAVVLLFSVAVFIASMPGLLPAWRQTPFATPTRPVGDLLWLLPVMAFGFGLCPYLDATFHRARQSVTSRQSRLSFGIGFGVFFFACILFTLAYAPSIWRIVRTGLGSDAPWFEILLIAYIAIQVSFTMAAHVAAGVYGARNAVRAVFVAVLCVFVAAGLGLIAALVDGRIRGLLPGEFIYRLFMSFYGLVFPAYVWLCMIPTRDGHSGPSRDKVAVWIAAVVLAAPMFWMGFIERQAVWLAPGLAVVLLSRGVVMWRRSPPRSSSLATARSHGADDGARPAS